MRYTNVEKIKLSGKTAQAYRLKDTSDVFLVSYGMSTAAIVNGKPYLATGWADYKVCENHVIKFFTRFGVLPDTNIKNIPIIRTCFRDDLHVWDTWIGTVAGYYRYDMGCR